MIRISPFRFDFFERSDSEIPRLQYFSLEVELNKWRYDFTADTFLLLSSEYATLKTPGDCEIILMQNNSRSNSTISNPQLPKFFKFWFYSKLYFLISSVASESFFFQLSAAAFTPLVLWNRFLTFTFLSVAF